MWFSVEIIKQDNSIILKKLLSDEEDETTEERDTRLLESLKCNSHNHVTLNEENQLVWPVRLLYPEHATSDLIQQCSEVFGAVLLLTVDSDVGVPRQNFVVCRDLIKTNIGQLLGYHCSIVDGGAYTIIGGTTYFSSDLA